MGIKLYRSNRAEVLAERLGDLLAKPLAHPLAGDVVSVQGMGMERWLSMALARRFGVFANAEFPFPRALIERVLDAALGPSTATLPFDARGLGWAVADLVRTASATDPRLDEVTRYLERSDAADAWLDLGLRLGEVFDRMLLYRPELPARYEAGEHGDLRAALWRMLVERHGNDHLAARAYRFLARAGRGESLVAHDPALPARLVLFGISSLPPLFMQILAALSTQREVHVFALTPTQEFMGDLARRSERNDALSLLGSVGRLSRDFQELLESDVDYEEPHEDLFFDPEPDTLLHQLQSDLLHLRSRGEGSGDAPLSLKPDDRSIRVHDCHSRTRELEVLRDQLLDELARTPDLTPRDVVVLAPDIEKYAPAIQAVFGADDGRDALPYRVADRELGRSSRFASATLALLDLLCSRVTLSELADFLHRPLVHARFGLSAADVPRVVDWLEEAGARWGLSPEARARHDQPDESAGTIRSALERMWLGHAMGASEEETLWQGVLPFDDVEGQADRLEGLGRFVAELVRWDHALSAPRACRELSSQVSAALDAFLLDDASVAGERSLVRDALASVGAAAEAAGCDAPITLRSFRGVLERELTAQGRSHDFLKGGITFCRHVPMRALPFRVVCLLGMDDESFPRRVPSASFDPVAEHPRRGDRTPADDDRQVFLEALLSARDRLIVTHCGRAIEDNAVRPRAAVVDQLLDVIDGGWVPTDARGTPSLLEPRRARERIVQQHMLWPFDARYFDEAPDAEWFSYDALAARARQALTLPAQHVRPFVEGPLAPREDPEVVRIDELVAFFRHPARAYLQRGLDLVLPRDQPPLPDREPALLQGLDRFRVAAYLLDDDALRGQLARLHARSLLPLGDAGRFELESTQALLRTLESAVDVRGRPERVRIECVLDDVRVVGEVDGVYPELHCQVEVAQLRPKHTLSFWIQHVALCTQVPRRGALVGRFGERAEVRGFGVVADARQHLAELVRIYQRGRRIPLPLLPDASEAYAAALIRKKKSDRKVALSAAENALNNRGFDDRSVGDDPPLNQIYGLASRRRLAEIELACLDETERFEALALAVFGPMLRAQEAT